MQLEIQRWDTSWVARVKREDAPRRDAVEQNTVDTLLQRGRADLWVEFYDETSPSSSRKAGGRLLADPSIELEFEDGRRPTLTA